MCDVYKHLVFKAPRAVNGYGKCIRGATFLVLMLAPLAICLTVLRYVPEANRIQSDILEIESANLDLGELWVTDAFDWSIRIANRTDETIRIREFVTSCNCLSVVPSSLVLKPGEAKDARLAINLMPARLDEKATAPRSFLLEVSAVCERASVAQTSIVSWTFRGKFKSSIYLNEDALRLSVNAKTRPAARIRVHADIALSDLSVESNDPRLLLTASLIDDHTGELCVELADLPQIGQELEVPFRLQPVAAGKVQLPSFPLSLHVSVEPAFRVDPNELALGLQRIGSVHKCDISISSWDGSPLPSLTAVCSSSSVKITPKLRVGNDSRIDYEVEVTVNTSGQGVAKVDFADETGATCPLKITYIGTSP